MRFVGELDTRAIPPNKFRLLAPLEFTAKNKTKIVVPEGFVTDLASIPFGFRNIFPVNDVHRKAAVVHDYLYDKKLFSKARSDEIFLEAMECLGVARWKRVAMYYAVKWFGLFAWRKKK